MIAIVGTME